MARIVDPESDRQTAIVSRSVFTGQRKLNYAQRENSYSDTDTGWRMIGDGDTQGYLNHEGNVLVMDIRTLCTIEPLIKDILNAEKGTAWTLVDDEGGRRFVKAE